MPVLYGHWSLGSSILSGYPRASAQLHGVSGRGIPHDIWLCAIISQFSAAGGDVGSLATCCFGWIRA